LPATAEDFVGIQKFRPKYFIERGRWKCRTGIKRTNTHWSI